MLSCRDSESLLPLFFDGELDSKRMRAVALHATKCPECETTLRDFEAVQSQVQSLFAAEVDSVDFSNLWTSIESRLPPARPSFWLRMRAWWEDQEDGSWNWAVPGAALASVVAVLALLASLNSEPSILPGDAPRIAATDYATSIEHLETVLDSVAVFNDPDTHTTVLWIGSDAELAAEEGDGWVGTEVE